MTVRSLFVCVSSGISATIEIGGSQSVTADAFNAAILERVQVEVRNSRLAERSLDANASVGSSILVSGNPATTTIDSSTGGSVSFAP